MCEYLVMQSTCPAVYTIEDLLQGCLMSLKTQSSLKSYSPAYNFSLTTIFEKPKLDRKLNKILEEDK